jgi:hypothetical protein
LVLASLTVQVPGIVLAPCFTCCQWWLLVFINRNFLCPCYPISNLSRMHHILLIYVSSKMWLLLLLVVEVVQFYSSCCHDNQQDAYCL